MKLKIKKPDHSAVWPIMFDAIKFANPTVRLSDKPWPKTGGPYSGMINFNQGAIWVDENITPEFKVFVFLHELGHFIQWREKDYSILRWSDLFDNRHQGKDKNLYHKFILFEANACERGLQTIRPTKEFIEDHVHNQTFGSLVRYAIQFGNPRKILSQFVEETSTKEIKKYMPTIWESLSNVIKLNLKYNFI